MQVNTNSNADVRAKPVEFAKHTFAKGQGPEVTSHVEDCEQHQLRNVAIGGEAGIPHRSEPASASADPGEGGYPQEMKRVLQESIATVKEQLRHAKAAEEDDTPSEPPQPPQQQPQAAPQPTQSSLHSRARKTRLLPAARLSAPGEGPRRGTSPATIVLGVLAAQGQGARGASRAAAAGGREEVAQNRAGQGARERRRASSHYSSSDDEEDDGHQRRCTLNLTRNPKPSKQTLSPEN